ncbi:nuclear transport factor 2 family protein [Streptomyces sp. NRRL WC-3742]|uniref:nuclear transport factor 2 family protein n=1 Tax=Streptomyces sp. NRRL WC-3742 TaxID=1463934 RepID=UPI0004CC21FC|nr:nuclear transport factor 2 family protein [Streptomyces sp. NRRL WC-3742]
MTTRDPRTVVADYVNAVAEGDLPTILASFAEDVTWTYPGDLPMTGVWRGRDAVVNDFLGSGATLLAPGTTVEIELTNVIADGEQVVAEWTAKGTTLHGHRYDNACLGIFTVRGGVITAVREYLDTQHAERTLFAGPRPEGPDA